MKYILFKSFKKLVGVGSEAHVTGFRMFRITNSVKCRFYH